MSDQPNPPDLEVDIPMPGGLKVTGEEPYHMLVVNDFAGSTDGSIEGPLQSGVVEVNAESFDEVMAVAAPSVNFTATDPLATGSAMVEVNLRFESLRAFDPKHLATQLPATTSLMAVREKITERLRGKIPGDALTGAIDQAVAADSSLSWLTEAMKWTPSSPGSDPDVVDGLMGQLDLGDAEEGDKQSAPPPKSPIGSLVSAAASDGSAIPAEEASTLRRALAEIDRRASAWLNMVLHAPQVQSLEQAWRSLAYLVKKTEFRKGLRISLLHAPAATRMERFVSLLIDPVFDEGADSPHLIILDEQFGNTAADMETLDQLAQHAASLPAVALAGASSQFFGVKHAWQIATLPTIPNLFDQYQFAKWKMLRGELYARALGVVFGRCLLRSPYGRDAKDDLAFNFKESAIAEKDFCWAAGVIPAAACVARSVADRGWPTAMAGYVHGRVDGFATGVGGKMGDKKVGPTDTQLPQPKIEEMAAVGLNAAVGVKDHDDVLIWNGLTAARPHRMDPDALLEVSLPYQLFAGRLSALLFDLKAHLAGMDHDKIAPFVMKHVQTWLGFTGDVSQEQLSVQTRPSEDDPKVLELAVTVTPPQSVLAGGIPVVMGYRLS